MASQFKTFVAGDVLTASEVNSYLMKQSVIVCDSVADYPGSPVEGMTVYDKALDSTLTYDGSGWVITSVIGTTNGKQTYTPAVTQSGSVGVTVNWADWVQCGAVVHAWVGLTVTGSGTGGTAITVSLPTTSATSDHLIGNGFIADASTGTRYNAATYETSATVVGFRTDGATALWGNNPSVALASGDGIQFQVTYLAA